MSGGSNSRQHRCQHTNRQRIFQKRTKGHFPGSKATDSNADTLGCSRWFRYADWDSDNDFMQSATACMARERHRLQTVGMALCANLSVFSGVVAVAHLLKSGGASVLAPGYLEHDLIRVF